MASWSDLIGKGGTVAEQLLVWSILSEVVGDLLAPTLDVLRQDVYQANPVSVATPPELADQVVRGIIDQAAAAAEATRSGIDGDRFSRAVEGAGEPPGLEFVLEALRRGYIGVGDKSDNGPSLMNAIAKSRVYTYWSEVIQKMADRPISVGDAVDATLRQQRPQADMEAEAYANGINAERFQILLDSAGRPPSPTELIELRRRGLIPMKGRGAKVLSVEQGIYEGDAKDKWEPAYEALVTAYPPPRTITTLLAHGVVDEATAATWFSYAGLDPVAVKAYVASATAARLVAHKNLAESQVIALYADQLIARPAAEAMLATLGYDPAEATYILEVQDFVRERAALSAAVTRVHSLYVGRHITRGSAIDALTALDVPDATRTQLLATWDTERAANVKTLTAAQVEAAVYYGIETQEWGQSRLVEMGYTEQDAWIAISVRLRGSASGHAPAPGPNPGEATPVGE